MTAMNIAGKKENAGAKMFANKLLFIAATVASVLFFMDIDLWRVPASILVVFSTLEWALSFCVACWSYGYWYKLFPPQQ